MLLRPEAFRHPSRQSHGGGAEAEVVSGDLATRAEQLVVIRPVRVGEQFEPVVLSCKRDF